MNTKSHPARVHIILARNAPTAVVIRRGPAKSVCTMLWDRRRDTFTLGQWLRGRIYERRCDVSPDGTHFIYFALNGKWKSETKGSWTAISRAPYLKAIGLWGNGSAWNGGGLFMDDRRYWLNTFMFGHHEMSAPGHLRRHTQHPLGESYGGECPGVYYIQLQRDGWRMLGHERANKDGVSTFEKDLPKGWVLVKRAHATIDHPVGKGCYFDTHALRHKRTGDMIDFPEWEWADLDGERLVWVDKGVLYGSKLGTKGIRFARPIHDFNSMTFERVIAPY